MSRADSPDNADKPVSAEPLIPAPLPMPDVVYERYKGPAELAVSVTRATVLGTAGWFIGKIIGDWGAHPKTKIEKYSPVKGRVMGGLFASAGAMMGLYSASRESREAHKQHYTLQRAVMEIHEENLELRHALHDIKAQADVSKAKPELSAVTPAESTVKTPAGDADERTAPALVSNAQHAAPDTQIEAESVSMAAMQHAEGKSQVNQEHSARA